MKAFKRYSQARTAAQGGPIVRIGDLFIVGATLANLGLDEISLIDSSTGQIVGNITLRHLNRLGNANWAESKPDSPFKQTKQLWPSPTKAVRS